MIRLQNLVGSYAKQIYQINELVMEINRCERASEMIYYARLDYTQPNDFCFVKEQFWIIIFITSH